MCLLAHNTTIIHISYRCLLSVVRCTERNWQLLEDKGDLELSVAHVRDIATDPRMHLRLSDWSAALKGIQQLEQSLSEHQTVVQVRSHPLPYCHVVAP